MRASLRVALAAAALLALPAYAANTFVGWVGIPLFGGVESGIVPDVLGDDLATATTAIEGAGFVVGQTLTQCSTETVGLVVDQNPDSGESAVLASAVALWLSSGVACGDGKPRLWLKLQLELMELFQ